MSGRILRVSSDRTNAPVALVASTGGHLAELIEVARHYRQAQPRLWLVPESLQSESLLRGQNIVHISDVPPRDAIALARAATQTIGILRKHRPNSVVSTGAGIALGVLPIAAAGGVAAHYVESAARIHEPSLTGKLLASTPGVRTWHQSRSARWREGRWRYAGSIFDSFSSVPKDEAPPACPPRRLVVTLGTQANFSFARLIRAITEILPADVEVLWQATSADLRASGVDGHQWIDPETLKRAMATADVVIAHAGVGSALAALQSGTMPILVPRLSSQNEHVDDHQSDFASDLAGRGLAITVHADGLTYDLLRKACSFVIRRASADADCNWFEQSNNTAELIA